MKQRLAKVLAWSGVASRRKCEEIISERRVTVNGEIATLPQQQVDPSEDTIAVDGERVKLERKSTYLLHKPRGYLCSSKRVNRRDRLAIDLIDHDSARLYTIGRLDKDTSGLLLITNDGHFAQQVAHPSNEVQKEYVAKVDKEITHRHLAAISKGTKVEGVFVRPLKVAKVRRNTVKVVVTDGRKHEVRELIAHAGLECIELKRIRVGNLRLGNLPAGQHRVLSEAELQSLFE